jgi:hypothetical protein
VVVNKSAGVGSPLCRRRDPFRRRGANDLLVERREERPRARRGREAVCVREADWVGGPEPGSVDHDGIAGPVDRDAERGDRLSSPSQTLPIVRRSDEDLGEIDGADQPALLPLVPGREQRACLVVMRIAGVERADQDVGVQDDAQRSPSSRSSRAR